MFSMTDRAVEIVHWTGRHGDNQPPAGTEKVVRQQESAVRSVKMLENLAADDSVCLPVKPRNGGAMTIKIALHKLRFR